MEKSTVFNNRLLPYLLLFPQLVITVVFFYWPASQAIWQSFLREDAFGLVSEFVGFENYTALLFASQADKNLKAVGAYKTFMIWPYAVAPAVAGVLWFFMFQPSLGML